MIINIWPLDVRFRGLAMMRATAIVDVEGVVRRVCHVEDGFRLLTPLFLSLSLSLALHVSFDFDVCVPWCRG